MILSFSNNCDKKLIPLLENFGKYIAVPSTLTDLLHQKNWDNIWEEVSGDPEWLWLQQKSSKVSKSHSVWGSSFSKEDFLEKWFEWNLKEGPIVLFNW